MLLVLLLQLSTSTSAEEESFEVSLIQQRLELRLSSDVNQKAGREKYNILCVGDSITYGCGASYSEKSYPKQLQELLGQEFQVYNFGDSHGTARKRHGEPLDMHAVRTHDLHSYWDSDIFKNALEHADIADAVVIMIGTNDAKAWAHQDLNRTQHLMEFRSDYTELVGLFQNASSQPKVYLMVPPPLYSDLSTIVRDWNQTFINTVLPVEISQLAQATGAQLAGSAFSAYKELCPISSSGTCPLMLGLPFPQYCNTDVLPTPFVGNMLPKVSDGLHPGDEGYKVIADVVFGALSVDFPTEG